MKKLLTPCVSQNESNLLEEIISSVAISHEHSIYLKNSFAFFSFSAFPPNFASSWKVVTRAYSDGAAQLKNGARENPTINTELFITLVVAAQRARTRQATVFAERQSRTSHDQR